MTGEQTYNISSGTSVHPKFVQAVVNPIDVLRGGTQLVTVKVRDILGNPITSVTGTAILNNASVPISFSLISGTALDGTWQGSWVMPNNAHYCTQYQESFNATSASGTANVTLSFK